VEIVTLVSSISFFQPPLKQNWNTTTNPLPYMDDVVGTVLTDFFSGSVTQYTKSVEGEWANIQYVHWSNP
jgi:ribonucleotide reductase beta subunit family protein with ferritin-like domain